MLLFHDFPLCNQTSIEINTLDICFLDLPSHVRRMNQNQGHILFIIKCICRLFLVFDCRLVFLWDVRLFGSILQGILFILHFKDNTFLMIESLCCSCCFVFLWDMRLFGSMLQENIHRVF